MKRMTPQRVAVFVGVMSAFAIVLYLPRYEQEQRQAQIALQQQQTAANEAAAQAKAQAAAQAQQAAAQRDAAERAAYQSRYLNPGFSRKAGLKNVAIAAANGDEPNHSVAAALSNRLKDENLVLFTSFFKPAFYADGLFSNVFAGASDSISALQLTNTLDALLLAQEQLGYSTSGADLDHVITARARLEVVFLPLDLMRREQSWTFTASGAGFSQGEARKNAEERLFKQITGDTNMSLVPLSP